MKLQEKRLEREMGQKELADRIGTNVPMVSNFECYKCLPVPKTLDEICEALGCDVNEIYSDAELYIKPKKGCLKAETRGEPNVYKLTVRLPDEARNLFTQANLEKCGYHSLKDFVWHCYKRFEKQLTIITEKEKATKELHSLATREK